MVTYASWLDPRTQTWEVIRWENKKATIVQRNIRTKAKAIEARGLWQERQRLADMAAILADNVVPPKETD